MSVTPYRAYAIYNAVKLHFNGQYDAVKYNYKSRVNPSSYEKFPQKFIFEKLAKRFEDEASAVLFFASQYVHNLAFYIGNYDEELYTPMRAYLESYEYQFGKRLTALIAEYGFNQLIAESENGPLIMDLYLQKKISWMTIVGFFKVVPTSKVVVKSQHPLVWKDFEWKVNKFIALDLLPDYKTLYTAIGKSIERAV